MSVADSKPLRWLLVEDALRDRNGHWFEYVTTFRLGLAALGDQLTVLSDRCAQPFIRESLSVEPILPDSIWHRMSDGAGAAKRYLRVPLHAWQTWGALRRFLRREANWDVIFVPTVLVHHLLGWYWLIRSSLRRSQGSLLLFFPNLPIHLGSDGAPAWNPSPTTLIMRWILRRLAPDIRASRVILGVETLEMRDAFSRLSGLPVRYFPHPVPPLETIEPPAIRDGILMGCYGPGRPEKGSDILQEAISDYFVRYPDGAARFAFQWLQDFVNEGGEKIGVLPSFESCPRVDVVRRYFGEGEYAKHLRQTQVMLVPYRRSSYALRVSRVIIEAMVNGIPTVATAQTTLASQAAQFGAAILCEDGSAGSLLSAIHQAEKDYPQLRAQALARMPAARAHFSVEKFREVLLETA